MGEVGNGVDIFRPVSAWIRYKYSVYFSRVRELPKSVGIRVHQFVHQIGDRRDVG